MYRAYAGTQDSARQRLPKLTDCYLVSRNALASSAERFANPVADRFHLDLGAGNLAQELVRGRALALRPQLAQKRSRLGGGEPGRPEALAQVVSQLRLERPRAQVRVDVETGVDIGEVVRRAGFDLGRAPEQLDVSARHRGGVASG